MQIQAAAAAAHKVRGSEVICQNGVEHVRSKNEMQFLFFKYLFFSDSYQCGM
jgi:hypothetical protein